MPSHLLLIDDDPVVQHILSLCVNGLGFELRVAGSGRAGIEALEGAVADGAMPGAIFLDNFLGDMQGHEVLASIRAKEKLKSVPVIYLSANPETEVRNLVPGFSVEFYLQKPFTPQQIKDALAAAGVM